MKASGQRYDLCAVCAAQEAAKLTEAGMMLVRIEGGVNNKITCWGCQRRRYGATYEMRKAGYEEEHDGQR